MSKPYIWTEKKLRSIIAMMNDGKTKEEIRAELGCSMIALKVKIAQLQTGTISSTLKRTYNPKNINSYKYELRNNLLAINIRAEELGMSYGQYCSSKQYVKDMEEGFFDD